MSSGRPSREGSRELLLVVAAALACAALHLAILPSDARERSDLPLYLDSSLAWASGSVPYVEVPFEYPPAALLLLRVPLHFAAATGLRYETAFALWMALFDALALASIWFAARSRGRGWSWGALASGAVLLALCASVLHTRFDLAPGALMALAVACAGTARRAKPGPARSGGVADLAAGLVAGPGAAHVGAGEAGSSAAQGAALDAGSARLGGSLPALAGAALGAAAAIKLYPLALAPALAVAIFQRDGARALRQALVAGTFALLVCSAPAALEAGPAALSFLRYHAARGVQMQSLWAGAMLVLARLRGAAVPIVHAFGAEELPGAPGFLAPLSVLLQLSCGLLAARAVRRGAPVAVAALAAFAGFVAFSKVGSPQFFLALAPLAACALPEAPVEVALVALSTALLAWEFPRHFGALFHNQGPWAFVVLFRMLLLAAVSVRLLQRRVESRP